MTLADRVDAALAGLYAQVPDVACKGLCHDQCTVVSGHPRELARIRRAGVRMPSVADVATRMRRLDDGSVAIAPDPTSGLRCPALTDDNRCGVYARRPMICRLWGASEALPCDHGCVPVDGRDILTDTETAALLHASFDPLASLPTQEQP